MDRKKQVNAAMVRYYQRLDRENNPKPARKNKSPERDTEAQVLSWCRQNDFHMHVVDSSRYDGFRKSLSKAQKAEVGFPDLCGNTGEGLSVWIELKAKDRRSTVSPAQRRFLEKKIEQQAFAVVVDKADRLDQYWRKYCSLKTPLEKKNYLIDCMPKQVAKKSDPEGLGF